MKALMLLPAAACLALASGCQTVADEVAVTQSAAVPEAEVNAFAGSAPTIVESYGQASPRQFGELRVPDGRGPFPVAMLVHGGCWSGYGSPKNMIAIADWLRARGVATWNVDYRELGSGGGWTATFDDWAAGLASLKDLSAKYSLDLSRITVVGHSAGAPAASWLASGSQGDEIVKRDLPDVMGIVILDGPMELTTYAGGIDAAVCGRPVIGPLMGGLPDQVPARYAMLDPRKNPPEVKQALIVDAMLPPHEETVLSALRDKGIAVEIVMGAQDRHFDVLKPGTADFAAYASAMLRVTTGR